jgi:hypothetical protein
MLRDPIVRVLFARSNNTPDILLEEPASFASSFASDSGASSLCLSTP